MHRRTSTFLLLLPCLWLLAAPGEARRQRLDLISTSVQLPGPPATILWPDLDGDGHRDLLVMVAYTEWDQLAIEESTEMDGVEGLMEVMTIVPALTDRRELHLFLGNGDGTYRAAGQRPLEPDILALEPGPASAPVLVLTDDGLAALRWRADAAADQRLVFERLHDDPPVFAGSRTFLPRLGLSHDLDGDGRLDFLLPADDGLAVYLTPPQGPPAATGQYLLAANDRRRAGAQPWRRYPLPRVEDTNGDGVSDLIFTDDKEADTLTFHVLRGGDAGDGLFASVAAPLSLELPCPEELDSDDDCAERDTELVHFGDLDGDGRAEYVMQLELPPPGDGMRQELGHAKRPPFRYQLFHSGIDGSPEAAPYTTFEALGYSFNNSDGDGDGLSIPGGLQDLDGDGRKDLITLTLDFSLFQVMRVMTTRSLSIGLDFHIYCQGSDGTFQGVPNLDLSGKFKLDLDDIRLRQLSFFDGDFDGDGKADFVQLGRGRSVSIHRGQAGCAYSAKPDLTIELEEEPRNVALVRIEDFDADGFSDLLIVQPNRIDEPGVTPPVRLDLYLSGQGAQP